MRANIIYIPEAHEGEVQDREEAAEDVGEPGAGGAAGVQLGQGEVDAHLPPRLVPLVRAGGVGQVGVDVQQHVDLTAGVVR